MFFSEFTVTVNYLLVSGGRFFKRITQIVKAIITMIARRENAPSATVEYNAATQHKYKTYAL